MNDSNATKLPDGAVKAAARYARNDDGQNPPVPRPAGAQTVNDFIAGVRWAIEQANDDQANALRYAKRLGHIAEIVATYEMNGSQFEGLAIDKIKAVLNGD